MGSRERALTSIALGLALSIVLIGCGQGNQQQEGTDQGGQQQEEPQGAEALKLDVVEQWLESPHSKVVGFAAVEEGCKNCHDGQTFMKTGGGFAPRQAETTGSTTGTGTAGEAEPGEPAEGERDWVVAADCRVCHAGQGVEAAQAGEIDIPGQTVEAGMGSLCISCHNGWHGPGPNQEGQQRAPHSSVQGDMLFSANIATVTPAGGSTGGTGTVETENPHQEAQDTCVGCHVLGNGVPGEEREEGVPSHLMRAEGGEGCVGQDCHSEDPTDQNVETDVDGDGQNEPFQTEVEGLMEALKSAIEKSAGGTFKSEGGAIVFAGGAKPDAADYAAAYNYLYVLDDGSNGVHNPKFTQTLLQVSIDSVGGQ